MQSSSGGDEEYDSRAESSISAFIINNPRQPQNNHVVGLNPFTISTTTTNSHTLPPQQQQHHHNTHMFDPLSNYLDPMQRSPSLPNSNNALLNLDMMWYKTLRSEPNQTDLDGLMIPCSSQQNQQALLSRQVPGQTIRDSAAFLATQHHSLADPQSASRGLLSVSAANNNDQPRNTNTNVVRNPKKRSRASRRAPTTVLTTDTTNFRAMVQEFTGIPAPPFTSSPFPRTRLDLFGSAVSTSTVRATLLEPSPPPYLLRPFAQKLHHHHLNPFPPSTSSFPPPSNSMMDTLLASNNSTNSATNSTSINYQLSSPSGVEHLGLLKHPLNFNNMPNNNPILSFQNMLQAPPKYPPGNPSALAASKTQQPSLEIPPPSSGDSHLKVGVFEELGLRHAHVNNNTNVVSGLHQNLVSSPSVGALSSGNNNNNLSNASTEWAQRTGTITNNDCEHGGGGRLGGTVNYSDVAERVTNGKVHYSASSSDFRGEKGTECTVAARSEGMVESWINCPDN